MGFTIFGLNMRKIFLIVIFPPKNCDYDLNCDYSLLIELQVYICGLNYSIYYITIPMEKSQNSDISGHEICYG